MWRIDLFVLVLFLPSVELCTVDGGEFLQVLQVKEETTLGAVVGKLNLDNPEAVSSIKVSEDNSYIAFSSQIDENGKLGGFFTVSKRIDVDQGLNRIQTLYLECTTNSRLKLEIEIEIELIDVNDHTPEFIPSNSYEFSISERAPPDTQIGIIKAKDGDRLNSFVQYELQDLDQDLFGLKTLRDGGTAIIMLNSLDYEKQANYTVLVTAKDCQKRSDCTISQRSSTATVYITVLDADDLNPEFDQKNYPVSLSNQASNGDLVVQVSAHDQDTLSAEIVYSLSGEGSSYFDIDSVTGKVTVTDNKGLKEGENILMHVKASQLVDRSKSVTAPLFISVFSPDADRPKFTERSYTLFISEYAQLNSTILSIAINYNIQPNIPEMFKAHFKPQKSESAAPLVVEIIDSTDSEEPFFGVNHTDLTAELFLLRQMDFEEKPVHKIKISASNDKHSDEAEITIYILNENDNNPEFGKKSYRFGMEYSPQGIVGTVSATDADFTSPAEEINYRILHSDVSPYYTVNKTSGQIKLTGNDTDYSQGSYTLIIEASDLGNPPRTTNVLIMIAITVPSLYATDAESVHKDHISSDKSEHDKIIVYTVASVAALLLVIVSLMAACLCKKKYDINQQKKQRREQVEKNPHEKSLLPVHGDQSADLTLNMLTPNGRHEATYRNMSDLNNDINYCSMWNSSVSDNEETKTLIHSPDQNTTNSDSGRSSCGEKPEDIDATSYGANDSVTLKQSDSAQKDSSDRRGALSKIVQEKQSKLTKTTESGHKDQGFLVEAPAGFRTPTNSRPASPTLSMLSDYQNSNTSDYGSHIIPADKAHYKLGRLKDSLVPRDCNSSEPALHTLNNNTHSASDQSSTVIMMISPKKSHLHRVLSTDSIGEAKYKTPFTTFHGDVV